VIRFLFKKGGREMKRIIIIMSLIVVFGLSSIANATLINRGGGLIYDDDLKITWLQDANYAQTSGYDSDGRMTWDDAVAWADQLVYGGYDDWRLPQILPINGSSYDYIPAYDGSTDRGWNISAPGSSYPGSTSSEMAYMFYVNLSNLAYYDTSGNYPQSGWGLQNTGPFENLQSHAYWSGLEYAPDPVHQAWYFYPHFGDQTNAGKLSLMYSWAVRDGDVTPIPEPSTYLLLGSGLIGLVWFRRKFRKR